MIALRFIIPPPLAAVLGVLVWLQIREASPVFFSGPSMNIEENSSGQKTNPLEKTAHLALPAPYVGATSDISDRPLFSETRRRVAAVPSQKPVVVPKVTPMSVRQPMVKPIDPPAVELRGLTGDRKKLRALVAILGEKKEVWLSEGAIISGWMIAKIKHDEIIFRRGARDFIVKLYP